MMIKSNLRRQSGQAEPHGHGEAPATMGRAMRGQWIEVSIEYEGKRMVFPVNPGKLSISRGSRNVTHEALGIGEIVLSNPPALERINFSSQFWHDGDGTPSESHTDWLNEWRQKEKPGRFVIANQNPESAYRGYNKLVLCNDFDAAEGAAGHEDDVYYTLDLIEWRESTGLGEVEIEHDPVTGEAYIPMPGPRRVDERPLPGRTYAVRPGDSVFAITQSYGQPPGAWRELYEIPANRINLGENPYSLAANQILIMPGSWGDCRSARADPVRPPSMPPAPRPPRSGGGSGRGDGMQAAQT